MSDNCKQIIKIILISGLICFGIGVFFIDNILYYALGIAIGTAISAVRVWLLEKTLNKSVDMTPVDAQNYTRLQYSVRMFAIIAIAFLVIKVEQISTVGFVIGLLLVQPAVYITNLINRKQQQS